MSTPTLRPYPTLTLTGFDRCDRCGARAQMQVVLPSGGVLLFCTHHGRQHWAALTRQGADFRTTGDAS